jgi:dihydroorotate dehydrogenase electron transfer subunit
MLRGAEWGDAPLLPRPMSVLSGGEYPSLLIKVVGEGTRRMARAEGGEPYSVLGPLGTSWEVPGPERRAVLVAGGVGVAPLLFWARELAASGRNFVVLYGGRSRRDLPLIEELEELGQVYVTTEDGSRGKSGRVTQLLPEIVTDADEVFTCGPDAMMAKVAQYCSSVGVRCQASLETPMACGYGVCLGCAVKTSSGAYLYACMQGPCVDAATIDWQHSASDVAGRAS